MLEWGVWLGLSYLLYKNLYNKSERTIIEDIFQNIGFGLQGKTPHYLYSKKEEAYSIYGYSLPYGLVDVSKLEEIIGKTLNKNVEVKLEAHLKIKIYHQKLGTEYKYEFIPTKDWLVPVGHTLEGIIYHDFDKIPHMTVAGATRWGKTVFMKSLMTHLIENQSENVQFYILDLKGGLAFHRYKNLKQVHSIAGNYKESAEVLKAVEKDIKKTMQEFKRVNDENITDTNRKGRKFILIDEAGELVPNKSMTDEDKEHAQTCRRIMSHIVRVAGGLGYRMIFGTQYPTAKIMDNQIKANSAAKITFKLETSIQSKVAIDEVGAEKLQYPGRAIYRTTERHLVQTPYISNEEMWERLRRYEVEPNEEENPTTRKNIIHFG